MTDGLSNSTEELQRLRERIKRLGEEKAWLQLVIDTMVKLGSTPGLDNTIDAILHGLLAAFGGTNVTLYYFVGQEAYIADLFGTRERVERVEDRLVKQAMDNREFVAVAGAFEQTHLLTPAFSAAWTWAFPLLAGDELVGAGKVTDSIVGARDAMDLLRPLFNHVAAILKNEILADAVSRSERRYRNIFESAAVSLWEEDFTALKQAIDSLKAQGVTDFRRYLADHPDFMLHALSLVKVKDVNPQTVQMFGASSKEDLLASFEQVFTPESLRVIAEEMLAIAEGAHYFRAEAPLRTLRGTPLDVLLTIVFPDSTAYDRALVSIMDITERKRAEEQLQRYAERLAVLSRLDRVISSSLRIEEMFNIFVQEMGRLIAFDRVGIIAFDEAGQRWQVLKQWLAGEALIRAGEWREIPGSGMDWVVTHRAPLVERRLGERSEWPEIALLCQEGMRSCVLLPLIIKDRPIGALGLGSRREAAYGESDLEILQPLAEQLALALHNAQLYEQVQRYAAEMEQRVAARTAELAAANQELEAFSYSVSHDLRAPLRAVDGFSRILLEDYQDQLDDEGKRLLHVVRESTEKMDRMISDILAFSRTGRLELNRVTVDMSALVSSVVEELRAAAGHTVNVTIRDLPPVQGDMAMLRQVWANLLGNAFKFTSKKAEAEIEVGAQRAGQETVYFVRDNGAGFDMRYADRLFGVFQRLHSTEEFEGTGIGLAIVKRIITRHGGRVWAEGKVGEGATFCFALPT